jgi:hypothetical protein
LWEMDTAHHLVSIQEIAIVGFPHWKLGGINPHDRFLLSAGATKKFLKGDLLHYSYYTISEHQAQINSFSSILAKSYYEEGGKRTCSSFSSPGLWRFIRDYVIKTWVSGWFYGLVISVNSSHEVFLKYVKLRNIRLLRNERPGRSSAL